MKSKIKRYFIAYHNDLYQINSKTSLSFSINNKFSLINISSWYLVPHRCNMLFYIACSIDRYMTYPVPIYFSIRTNSFRDLRVQPTKQNKNAI